MMPPRHECPGVVDEAVPEGHDVAIPCEPELGLVPLIALLGDGQEMLATRLDELDRPAEKPGQIGHQHILGVGDGLGTESAPDVLGDDAHGVLGETQRPGQEATNDLGRLRRGPHDELTEIRVPSRDDPTRL
jgi:hypothetical protein